MKTSGTMNSATGHTSVSTRTGNFSDGLYDRVEARPDLDLDFARTKSLKDRISKENLITFTRSSGNTGYGATYVDENGLVKVAPVNLLKHSEQLDHTDWAKGSATFTADNVLAPNGTMSADTWGADSTRYGFYNSTAGSWATDHNQILYPFTITDEWVRYSISVTTASGQTGMRVYPLRTNNNLDYIYQSVSVTANTTYVFSAWYKKVGTKVYVWGCQLEKGSVATEYIPTTDQVSGAPRFTYDPVTKKSQGLLIEQAVTNLIFPSEDFSGYGNYNSSITTDQITAPDGTQTADKLQWDNSGSNPIAFKAKPANGVYTISAFFKKGNSDGAFIYADNPAFRCAIFDLENGTTGPKHGTFSKTTIEDFGNGWYRCSATTTAISGNNVGFGVCEKEQTSTTAVIPSTTDSHNYLWGSQVEAGIVLTSYIPTSGSTVTRSPDLASIDGDNFGTYRKNVVTNTSFRKASDGYLLTGPNANAIYESYAGISPSGNYDALKVTATSATGTHRILQFVTLDDSSVYSVSAYVKAGTSDKCIVNLWDGDSNVGTVRADLTAETATNISGVNVTNISITDVGNGWYLIQFTSISTTVSGAPAVIVSVLNATNSQTYAGNGESIFVWGMQAVKGNTPSEFIPSTDTYTNRQSNATFVDGNGIIRTSYNNKISHSEDFTTNGGFTTANVNIVSNTTTAPDGTQTASKWVMDSNSSARRRIQDGIGTNLINQVHTGSIYAKAGELSIVTVRLGRSITGTEAAKFNLSTGTIVQNGSLITSSSITPAGDGWYRLTVTNNLSNNLQQYFVISEDDSDQAYKAGDGSSGFFIWGAQVVKGTEAGDYYKTTGTQSGPPRYSHDPDTLTPTGLYLEPAATTLIPYSEDFTQSTWVKDFSTVTANATTAPDGTNTATLVTVDSSTNAHRLREVNNSIGPHQYTFSLFVKANTTSHIALSIYKGGATSATILYVRYKLDTEFVSDDPTLGTGTITKYPNGWYRLTGTSIPDSNTENATFAINILRDEDHPLTYAGNGQSAYIWGAQLEQNVVDTSYIPTSGATATRAADTFTSTATEVLDRANGTKPAFFTTEGLTIRCDCFFNDESEAPSFVNNSGVTVYPSSHVYNRVFQFNNSSNNLIFYTFANNFASYTNPRIPIFAVFGGTFYSQQTHPVDFDLHVVLRYQTNNSSLRIGNGSSRTNDTDMTAQKATRLIIGGAQSSNGTGSEMNGTIERLTIWKIPFDETESNPGPDSKLQKLAS